MIGKFVGNVGTVGVATGGEMADFMTIFAVAIAMGGQIYIAQLAGAKDEKRLKEAVGTLLTLLMGASVVVMAAALLFHRPILEMLNCPGEARGQAAQYMMTVSYTHLRRPAPPRPRPAGWSGRAECAESPWRSRDVYKRQGGDRRAAGAAGGL